MKSDEAFISAVDRIDALIESEEPLRVQLPGGAVDIERPLPVLLVHRTSGEDEATPQLLWGHSSMIIVSSDAPLEDLRRLIREVVRRMADEFGAFLVVELWAGAIGEPAAYGRELDVRIVVEGASDPPQPAEELRESLRSVRVGRLRPNVAIAEGSPAPPGLEPLLTPDELRASGCMLLGLEVQPVYRDDHGRTYPILVRAVRSALTTALQQAFFGFMRVQTGFEPKDYRELGRRRVLEIGTEIDRELAVIAAELDFLLNITPVNTDVAFEGFVSSDFDEEPAFHYRFLPFDPDVLKRRLYRLPVESVEDPVLASLLRAKRLELDRMLTLLDDRDSPRFLHGSLQLYPAVDEELLTEADTILSKLPDAAPSEAWVEPAEFAEMASWEIEHYRRSAPEMASKVRLRDDMPGIMVSQGDLHLSTKSRIARRRVEPLLHHEVGTHIVTFHNGSAQPLMMLRSGLPGYDQTQEGLAMFAEYVSGGLEAERLRTIAARVVAVDMVTKGAGFVEIFRRMHRDIGLPVTAAWSTTMRVVRGGGSSKDAIYLRGLKAVLDHVAAGRPFEPLLVGKIALEHVPLVEELLWRRILNRAFVTPRWLEVPGAEQRLERARTGLRPIDLIGS